MRTYLVVIDDSPEARVALRFAARRAARTAGGVTLLALVEPPEFMAWAGIQEAMDEEARLRIAALVAEVAGETLDEVGIRPSIIVADEEPIAAVTAALAGSGGEVAALVLGASASGRPGPLIEHFTGPMLGQLPCPVMLIPGHLDEAALDRLS